MNQTYLQENKEMLDQIAKEIALELPRPGIIRGKPKSKGGEIAVKAMKDEIYRYGVRLTQEGENMIYSHLITIRKVLKEKYKLDDFYGLEEATDLMAEYILEKAYGLANIPFESNYDRKKKRHQTYLKVKLLGVVIFFIFMIVVLIAALTQ